MLDLYGLAVALRRREQDAEAKIRYLQGLEVCLAQGHARVAADYLEGLAGIAAGEHQAARAARLFGASEASSHYVQSGLADAWRGNFGADVAMVRADLDQDEFNACWAQGRAMSWTEAARYGLEQEAGDF